ncbi:hypothetical protein Tco_0204886, partial [Tanacetum coccineum]
SKHGDEIEDGEIMEGSGNIPSSEAEKDQPYDFGEIQVVTKRDELLLRQYEALLTVDDTINKPVAWPCSLISLVVHDEDEEDDG